MKAVRFNVTIPKYLLARAVGKRSDAAVFGAVSGLGLDERSVPTSPGPDWAELRVRLAGICGTDIGNLTYSASTVLEPFGSFPAVLGHEILAEVVGAGSEVSGFSVGDRVVVDPMISCGVRGYDPSHFCPSCVGGLASTCERAGDPGLTKVEGSPLSAGMMIGYHRELSGGWGERMVAHRSQMFRVPDSIPDKVAVLIEPLSICLHAVIASGVLDRDVSSIMVIGSGTIALGTVWALRAAGYDGYVLSQAKRPHEQALARALGADDVVAPGAEAREALIGTGASAYMPIVGDEVYAGGGFPVIFDCVGSPSSLDQSMRFAAPRGMIVMLGCAARIPKLDLTLVWARELEIKGFVGYGREEFRGENRHTFEWTLAFAEQSKAPLADLVTHLFPLEQYAAALSAARNHRRSGAVKVVLRPGPS